MSVSDILDRARTGDVLTAYLLARDAQQEDPSDPNALLMRAVYASACGLREDCIAVIDAVPDILSHPMARMWGINALVLNVDIGRLKRHGLINLPEDPASLMALEPEMVLQIAFGLHLMIADPAADVDALRCIARSLLRYAVGKNAAHLAILAGQAAIKLNGPDALADWCRSTAADQTTDPLLDMLLPECYRTEPSRYERQMRALASRSLEAVFPVFGAVPRIAHRQPMPLADLPPSGGQTPVIDGDALAASLRQVRKIIEGWLAQQGEWQDWINAVAGDEAQPLLVASTGRVGTMATASALRLSPSLQPFHYLNNQPNILEQNRLLYMLIDGVLPKQTLIALLEDWLRSRRAEIDAARFAGRRAVLVNHLDTVFAPLLLACFPQARVIYAERNMRKTFLSLGYKNQFGYTQLRHLRYALDENGSGFAGIRDSALGHDEEVVWYMAITRALVGALRDVWGEAAVRPLDMDGVFAGKENAITAFCECFTLEKDLAGSVRSIFAGKINEKAFFALAPNIEEKVRAGLFEATWARVCNLPAP